MHWLLFLHCGVAVLTCKLADLPPSPPNTAPLSPLLVLALSELSAGLSLLLALLLLNKRSPAHPPAHCGFLSLLLLQVCNLCAEELDSIAKLCMPLLWCMPLQAFELGSEGTHEFKTAVVEQQAAGSNELFTLLPMHFMALKRACVVRDMIFVIQGGVLLVPLLLVVARLGWRVCCHVGTRSLPDVTVVREQPTRCARFQVQCA